MLACRPERITLQDINFAGRDEDIHNVNLINEALTDDDMSLPAMRYTCTALRVHAWLHAWMSGALLILFSVEFL